MLLTPRRVLRQVAEQLQEANAAAALANGFGGGEAGGAGGSPAAVVEAAPPEQGVFNMSCNALVGVDSRSFSGTAAPLATRDADKLFAIHVSRDCAAQRQV